MSDVMLLGVLRMPMSVETWEEDPIAVAQFIASAREAADRIEHDAKTIQELAEALRRCRFDSLNMSFDDMKFCRAALAKALGETA